MLQVCVVVGVIGQGRDYCGCSRLLFDRMAGCWRWRLAVCTSNKRTKVCPSENNLLRRGAVALGSKGRNSTTILSALQLRGISVGDEDIVLRTGRHWLCYRASRRSCRNANQCQARKYRPSDCSSDLVRLNTQVANTSTMASCGVKFQDEGSPS